MGEFKHGTSSAYDYHRCRCDICKAGKKERSRADYERNREKRLEQVRQYRLDNPDAVRERDKRYREKHADKKAAYNAQYQRDNAEAVNLKQRRWRENNKRKAWAYNWLNKNAKRGGPISDEVRAWVKSLTDETPCTYCGDPFGTLDHIVPVSAGGTNARENLTPACLPCNLRKNSLGVEVFLHRLQNEYRRPRPDDHQALPSEVTTGDNVSGVTICSFCGSADTQAGLDKVQCLACGNSTSFDGSQTVADSDAEEGRTVSDMTIPEPEALPVEPDPAPDAPEEPEAPVEPADTPDE